MQLKLKVIDFQQTKNKQDHELLIKFSQIKNAFQNNVQQPSSLQSSRNHPNVQQKNQSLKYHNDELLINIENPEEQNKIYIQFFSKHKNSSNIQYQGFSTINLRQIYPTFLTSKQQKIPLSSLFYGMNGQRENVDYQVYFIEAKQQINDDQNCSISICQNMDQKILTRTHSKKGQNSFNDQEQKKQPIQKMSETVIKDQTKLKKRWLMKPNEVIREQVYMENLNDSFSQKDQINSRTLNPKNKQKYDNVSTSGSEKLVISRKKKNNFLNQKFKLIKYMHELQINNLMTMEMQRRIDQNSD